MPTPPTIDVAEFIDAQPVRGFQVRILLACAAVLFLDGYDTQAVGYVAPAIGQSWHLARGALTPVFSGGLFGLMLGALIFSPVADRIGRKRLIVLSTTAFGLCALATALTHDVTTLLIVRFVTGLGLGGAMPNAVALAAEYSPHRKRATLVMITFCGFSVGAAVGGIVASWLIPAFGWPSVFIVGGALPLLLVPILATWLPESVRFLAIAGKGDRRVGDILRRLAPERLILRGTRFTAHEPASRGLSVGELFQDGRTALTVLLWIVFFMSLLDLYLLANWLPTALNELGASVSLAALIGAMFQVGGTVGALALGTVVDRFSYRALALIYLLAVVAVAAIGFVNHSIAFATVAIFCAGFCIVGGQTASNALASTSYPTAIRATGIGWALGIGRIGSIVGPAIGGIVLARQLPASFLFIAAAIPALIAALASAALIRAGSGKQARVAEIAAQSIGT